MKKLLVEGGDEKRVLPYLLEDLGIPWPEDARPADIEHHNGVEELLSPGVIDAYLKESELNAIGFVFDADTAPQDRWRSLREKFEPYVTEFPHRAPNGGVLLQATPGCKLGIWMMPDNFSAGMLEDFLATLVPRKAEALWKHAEASVEEAKVLGAPYRNSHLIKAKLHTWLAWQDPPGQQLHSAIMQNKLRSGGDLAKSFRDWFIALFGL